jgi:hypothetical protein
LFDPGRVFSIVYVRNISIKSAPGPTSSERRRRAKRLTFRRIRRKRLRPTGTRGRRTAGSRRTPFPTPTSAFSPSLRSPRFQASVRRNAKTQVHSSAARRVLKKDQNFPKIAQQRPDKGNKGKNGEPLWLRVRAINAMFR